MQVESCRHGGDTLDQSIGRPAGARVQPEPAQFGGAFQECGTCTGELQAPSSLMQICCHVAAYPAKLFND